MSETEKSPWKRSLYQLIIGGVAVLVALLVVLAVLWFGSRPSVPTAPLRLIRNQSGQMLPENEPPRRGAFLDVHAGKLQSQHSFASSSSESRSDNYRFACRRLAILSLSEHLLVARVGQGLVEQLKKLSYVEQIDYFPFNHRPEAGSLAPDLFITLDAASIEESGLLQRELKAELLVTAGTQFAHSQHFTCGGTAPPVVGVAFQGRLTHRSTRTGVESSAARYKQTSNDIAAQIAKQLTEKFDKLREANGLLPDLPADFYPKYRPPIPLPLLDEYQAERIVSCHGFLTHNDSIWQIRVQSDPATVLKAMKQRLEQAGWRSSSSSTEAPIHLTVAKEGISLEVFPAERSRASRNATPQLTAGSAAQSTTLFLHYVDRMSASEQQEAVRRLAEHSPSMDQLLLFHNHWPPDVQNLVLRQLEASPPADAQGWLMLAEFRQRKDQKQESLKALRRANLLVQMLPNAGSLDSRVKELAKKLGEKDLPNQKPAREMLQECGFRKLQPGTQIPDIEVAVGETAGFYATTARDAVRVVTLRVEGNSNAKSSDAYRLSFFELHEGNGRSYGSGGMRYMATIEGVCTAAFQAHPTSQKGKFRLTTEINKLPSSPAK